MDLLDVIDPDGNGMDGTNPYKSLPALFYGIILFMCAVSYNIVQAEVIKINGKDSQISEISEMI